MAHARQVREDAYNVSSSHLFELNYNFLIFFATKLNKAICRISFD